MLADVGCHWIWMFSSVQIKTQRINPKGVFSTSTYSHDILQTVTMEHLRSHPSKWRWPLLKARPWSVREETNRTFFLWLQIRLWHVRHVCHQVADTVTSIWSRVQGWRSSLFPIYVFAEIWRWHFTWTLPMNQTCIISLQINRFLYYPPSFVGYRCQTTRTVINKVATAYHEDYRYWQYGQHHQRYTNNHSPCWIAVELFHSLRNTTEKLLIILTRKITKTCSPHWGL